MTLRTILSVALSVPMLIGCATLRDDPLGCAIIGGVVGGVVGGAIGNQNDTQEGATLIGTTAGAALGAAVCGAFTRERPAPVAGISGGPFRGTAPLTVALRADAHDPDGEIVSYAWDLGDGGRSAADSLSHTYRQPGQYTAQLSVTDDDEQVTSTSVQIIVEAPVAAPPPPPRPPITLSDVLFEFDSAGLRPGVDAVLGDLVRELQQDSSLRVRVSGHTDSTGPEEYNQMLSQSRTNSVGEYLRQRGIEPSRVELRGFGESRPLADNASADGRALNRRVELQIVE